MATKLEKLGADLERARARQEQWSRRVKDLEERYREEESTVIQSMVHAANLTPEQLAEIIARAAQGMVGAYPEGMVPDENNDENKEEPYNDAN